MQTFILANKQEKILRNVPLNKQKKKKKNSKLLLQAAKHQTDVITPDKLIIPR